MSLVDVRAAIVATMADGLKSLGPACREHGGRFGKEEIKKLSIRTPAVLIGCLGVPEIKLGGDGKIEAMAAWGAFVVTSDKQGIKRDKAALALVASIAVLVPENTWGRDDVEIPGAMRADNLYSGVMQSTGIALWAVTWRQEVRLGGIDEAGLAIFETCHIDWDMAEPDEQIDAEDLITPLYTVE